MPMKTDIACVLLLLLLPVVAIGQNPRSYPFAQYPAEHLYEGKAVPPKLITPTQREFRTVLRRGAEKGPNFAGHYTVIEWGCGSNCVSFAVVDSLNGRIYDTGMPTVNDEYPCGLLYTLQSKLFVVEKSRDIGSDCKAYLYIWDDSRFQPVRDSTPDHRMMIFTAADGSFQFSHPSNFQVCTQGEIEPCIRFNIIPACERDAVVCLIYRAKLFEDTNFGAASFQVREIHTEHGAMTPDVCVTPYPQSVPAGVPTWPEFMISAQHPEEMIGGVLFVHGVRGEGATGHRKSVDLYRAFHEEQCLELSVSETSTDPTVTDPPLKTLTPAQRNELDDTMSEILHSFRFLK